LSKKEEARVGFYNCCCLSWKKTIEGFGKI